jgi:hypothetical protein
VWAAVAAGAVLLVIGIFCVAAVAAPGFLVDDDSDDSSSESSDDKGSDDAGPGGQPEVPIPPPNATDPGSTDVPPPSDESDDPDAPAPPEEPAGDPSGFAEEFLADVGAGDASAVDESMCLDDQEWQYEDAVGDQTSLSLDDPHADASAPDGIIGDLVGPEGTVDGRITVVPDDGGSWCVDTFYVF